MPMDSRSQIDANLNETNRVSLESAEALSAKRRRGGQSAGFSLEVLFDQLPDSLTVEFLCRLPLRSVLQFKCVCKEWRSLIKSPSFLQLLECHHNLFEKNHPVGLLLQDTLSDPWFVVCSGVPKSKCFGCSLEFPPGLRQHEHDLINLRGSCGDLLLCYNEVWVPKVYFIMNSVTREWAALPPFRRACKSVLTGLVCDPTSIPEAKKEAKLRYRVVRISILRRSENELNVEIFSSDDGQWNEYVMRCDAAGEIRFCCQTGVACNGRLYWEFRSRGGKIVTLDPFNPTKKEVVVIDSPPGSFDVVLRAEHLGIHGGKLRMCQRFVDGVCEPSRLHIWELEEGEGGAKWRSVKVASLDINVSRYQSWIFLALHPIDEDIIYLGCALLNVIMSCNMETSRLKRVCDYKFNKRNCHLISVSSIVMPWYPTPLPSSSKL